MTTLPALVEQIEKRQRARQASYDYAKESSGEPFTACGPQYHQDIGDLLRIINEMQEAFVPYQMMPQEIREAALMRPPKLGDLVVKLFQQSTGEIWAVEFSNPGVVPMGGSKVRRAAQC